jgi:hypothetical protein
MNGRGRLHQGVTNIYKEETTAALDVGSQNRANTSKLNCHEMRSLQSDSEIGTGCFAPRCVVLRGRGREASAGSDGKEVAPDPQLSRTLDTHEAGRDRRTSSLRAPAGTHSADAELAALAYTLIAEIWMSKNQASPGRPA